VLKLKNHRVIVYGSASLELLPENYKAFLDIRPPVKRGDLQTVLEQDENPKTILILDGLYGGNLAVTPTECRRLLFGGWTLIGASSMGALRASDLWSVGMIGIGEVYNMFRLGYLRSDADVAVTYSAVDYTECTASIVHVRAILSAMEKQQLISATVSRKMLLQSRKIYWLERYWDILSEQWLNYGISKEIITQFGKFSLDKRNHPKARDGLQAIEMILAKRWPNTTTFNY
jgi:hypothetical protein